MNRQAQMSSQCRQGALTSTESGAAVLMSEVMQITAVHVTVAGRSASLQSRKEAVCSVTHHIT